MEGDKSISYDQIVEWKKMREEDRPSDWENQVRKYIRMKEAMKIRLEFKRDVMIQKAKNLIREK